MFLTHKIAKVFSDSSLIKQITSSKLSELYQVSDIWFISILIDTIKSDSNKKTTLIAKKATTNSKRIRKIKILFHHNFGIFIIQKE